MFSKDYLEQLAKDCAFEYDPKTWNKKPTGLAKDRQAGNIVVFYRGRSIYNGVVALWGRDKSVVLFYATPHDVADEQKYGWIAPVFRFETSQSNCFKVPKESIAANPATENEEIPRPRPRPRMVFFENEIMQDANANRRIMEDANANRREF